MRSAGTSFGRKLSPGVTAAGVFAWQGVSETFSPATWSSVPAVAKNCALNLYGNDRQRRVVWNSLMIAALS